MRRYQLLEAGNYYRRGQTQVLDEQGALLCFCSKHTSKTWLLFAILLTLAFFIYLPFLPLSSSRPIAFVWPANQSRDANVLLRPNEVTTKLSPSSICRSNHSPPEHETSAVTRSNSSIDEELVLLVIVCSAMQNFQERQTIRDTWASENVPHTQVIFLLGHNGNDSSSLQANVTKESENHGDILQEDFIDSYANLTIKSLMLLKWFNQQCKQVPYVLKTDDDMYINVSNLYKLVALNKNPNLLVGTLICGATPIRDPYNKWFAPYYLYHMKRYPNYLSGTAYLMSKSATSTLFEASLETLMYHLEDVYVTGILAQVAGIRPQDHIGFSYVKRRPNACLYAQTISTHGVTIEEMKDMHRKVKEKEGNCVPIKKKLLRSYGPGSCKWSPPK